MQALNFNRKSIFFRFASVYSTMFADLPDEDICTYTRHVLMGMFTALVLTGVGTIASILALGDLPAWAVYCLIHGYTPLSKLGQINVIVDFGLIVLSTFIFAMYLISEKKILKKIPIPVHTPSFVKEAYKSFKNKTCVRITFD